MYNRVIPSILSPATKGIARHYIRRMSANSANHAFQLPSMLLVAMASTTPAKGVRPAENNADDDADDADGDADGDADAAPAPDAFATPASLSAGRHAATYELECIRLRQT
eukprot:5938681-Pleurochrysis_carterae.AAC.2